VSPESNRTTVLVVDDEREVADVYALRLDGQYETRTAYGGGAALAALEEDIDVVLLDRRMPGHSGDEVLDEIRDRGYDCRVIVLTAVDPGRDILDMPFDDYLCKPVEKGDLVQAIEQQLRVQRHEGRLGEYLELRSKLSLLEAELPPGSDEVDRLRSRAARLESELDDPENFEDFETVKRSFSNIDRRPG
jgi:DNA-binding response OmpR family regulator